MAARCSEARDRGAGAPLLLQQDVVRGQRQEVVQLARRAQVLEHRARLKELAGREFGNALLRGGVGREPFFPLPLSPSPPWHKRPHIVAQRSRAHARAPARQTYYIIYYIILY